jgi:tetratricopeptide (TPR) repeat protein
MLADRPEAAAGHAAAAGDRAAAARAWMAAAANAVGSYANRDAERLLGQAVAAAAQAGDPTMEAGARLDRGRVLVALGDYPAAFADQGRALELAVEHGQDRLEAAALEQLGWTAYYDRDHQAASALSPQARELAERAVAAPGTWPTAPPTCSARRPPAPIPASTPGSPWPSAPWSPATTPGPPACWSGPPASSTAPSATAGGSSCATPSWPAASTRRPPRPCWSWPGPTGRPSTRPWPWPASAAAPRPPA